MKCIVTAGPTYEELDEVRRMTNFSTGALGSELANFLAAQGHEVELLRGHYSTCGIEPKTARLQVFTTTADLSERLEKLASSETGAVFHAAAVSDFAFGKIWQRGAHGELIGIQSRKIPTSGGDILIQLSPTPKIIRRLRGWFPKAWLVGWKYELDGDRASVLAQGRSQLNDNQTDACVVNGAAYGEGFGLIDRAQYGHLSNKIELFQRLSELLPGGGQSR